MRTAKDLSIEEEPSTGVYCRRCIRLSPLEAVNVDPVAELAWLCCDHCGQRNEITERAARWFATRPETYLLGLTEEAHECKPTGATSSRSEALL